MSVAEATKIFFTLRLVVEERARVEKMSRPHIDVAELRRASDLDLAARFRFKRGDK